MKQSIRIIGGLYRGKKIHFPDITGLRPTPDRIRETLFNWLMHSIKGAHCLDAFAGSGALGLEAFSRGASKVVFIEKAQSAYNQLQKTLMQFKSTALHLIKADTLVYLQHCQEQFDIIFLDPPFSENYIPQCLHEIVQRKILKPGGLIYLESPSLIEINKNLWQEIKLKQAGQVIYGLFTLL